MPRTIYAACTLYYYMRKRFLIILTVVALLVAAIAYTLVYFSSKPASIAGYNPLNTFYQHKTIPVVLKTEILAALKYYPELKDTPIDFVFDPNTSQSIMLSQPVLKTFGRGKNNRSYVIKINPHFVMTHSWMPIQDVPKDILTGWVGHELGHIMDYRGRSNANMIIFGIRYLCSDQFKMQAERNADTYAVDHGLSDYIIKTKNFILNNTELSELYKARIKKLYLSPQQIMDMVKKIEKKPAHH
jgi:hypothetical protein